MSIRQTPTRELYWRAVANALEARDLAGVEALMYKFAVVDPYGCAELRDVLKFGVEMLGGAS